MKHTTRQENGLASIVIVFMMTMIISLLTLGFSRLMDRAIQQSTGNDLNAAADYAVRVGINEAAAYLKAFPGTGSTANPKCDDLTKDGQPLSHIGGLSGDENVKYTCVLVNTEPTDLFYQLLSPYKSQITKLQPKAGQNMDQMMVSWQASDRNKIVYPNNSFTQAGVNYDENTWGSNNFPPVLRLTLYPLPGTNKPKKNWQALVGPPATYKTIYLYPFSNTGTGKAESSVSHVMARSWDSLADGERLKVDCGAGDTGGFKGKTNGIDCNLIITGLPKSNAPGDDPLTFYARITPLYVTGTNVRFQAQTGSPDVKPVTFLTSQSIVDVTAKAGNSAKRLQARINIVPAEFVDPLLRPSEDAAPEYAVRSANTICKLEIVPKANNADVMFPDNFDPEKSGPYNKACPVNYPSTD